MAEDFGQPKTEQATPRRRQQARDQGQIALSNDLTAALLLLTCVAALWWGGRSAGHELLDSVRSALLWPAAAEWGAGHAMLTARWMTGHLAAATGTIVTMLFLVGIATGVLQSGVNLSLKPLEANWEKLSLANGWSRLMSLDGLMRGVSVTIKVAIVASVVVWYLSDRTRLLAMMGNGTLGRGVSVGWTLALQTAGVVAGAFLAVGAADYLYQRLRHEHKLMMTREEVRQEHKEDEGDPHVKGRLRKLQRDASERKMIQDVPRATVILTNPTHLAIALQYDRYTMTAPRVIAKGSGLFARRIVEIAREHGIPVLERKPIARFLYRAVKIGQDIPAELYQAMAEILAHVYRLRR